jgi:uncharacterized SAM-binding protein YcdF (DUF218 family)
VSNGRRRWLRPLLASLTCLAGLLAFGAWHAGSALVVSRQIAAPDAIVSLASHEWERLPHAARLATTFPEATVLLTLPPAPSVHSCHDCAHRADRLTRQGVQAARIRVIPLTLPGTHGEAVATLAFARRAGIHRLLVVTSPYHTRRSLATFQEVFAGSGIDVGIEPASSTSPAQPPRWWRNPYDRAYVAYEWAAVVYYVWKYGVPPAVM